MKKKIFLALGAVLLLFLGYIIYVFTTTRSHSPFNETKFSSTGIDLKVTYCQPYKKGRLIFGSEEDGALLPYGKYWRLGANDATEITFSKDVTFAGKPVKAGTYSMYAVPDTGSWQISLNSELDKSGYPDPNYDLDVAKVDVPTQSSDTEYEQLTINFAGEGDEIKMNINWDRTWVQVPIQI